MTRLTTGQWRKKRRQLGVPLMDPEDIEVNDILRGQDPFAAPDWVIRKLGEVTGNPFYSMLLEMREEQRATQ